VIALLGLPLAVAAGVLADVAARNRPLSHVQAFRRTRPRRPAGVLQAAGALLAAGGAALVGAAVLGAIPGSLATVLPALVATSAGARLALSDPTTRTLAARSAGDRLHTLPFEAVFVVAVVAAFARWRAPGLEAVRGAQAVLGPGLLVGPVLHGAALALAAIAIAVAGGGRVQRAEAGPPGRGLRPEGALLAAVARWSALGAGALVAAAVVAGPQVGSAGQWSAPARALPAWVAAVLASAALSGVASRTLGGRPAELRPRLLVLAVLAAFAAGSLALALA
jgi:hypothetical protein